MYLDARRDAVDDLDGSTVRVSGQRLSDAVDLHLAFGLRARLLPVDCLAGRTLQAAVLRGRREPGELRPLQKLRQKKAEPQ